MANDYETVWNAQLDLIRDFPELERDNLTYRAAQKAYNLPF